MQMMGANDHYLDLQDITAKYENKPEQLKNILERAHTIECNVRGCTLYADPDYERKQSSKQSHKQSVQRALAQKQDNFVKKAKGSTNRGGGGGAQLGMSEAKKVRLEKWLGTAAEMVKTATKAKQNLESSETISNFIPEPVRNAVIQGLAQAVAKKTWQ